MAMTVNVDELGPVDWIVVEFPGTKLTGEIAPILKDYVDRGATCGNDGRGWARVSISDLNTTAGASPSTACTAMHATTTSPGRQYGRK